jgi:hypothetical protein
MASVSTTPNLGLPQWVETEKPERTDFNTAFGILDDLVTGGSSLPFVNMPYVGSAPIVESGSNANGAYVKYADGTMLCWGTVTTSIACATALSSGGGYRSNAFTFPFPQTFHAAPTVVGTNLSPNDAMAVTVNSYSSGNPLTTGYVQWRTVSSAVSASRSASWIAFGRWKA